jgi:hypothetical protein
LRIFFHFPSSFLKLIFRYSKPPCSAYHPKKLGGLPAPQRVILGSASLSSAQDVPSQ